MQKKTLRVFKWLLIRNIRSSLMTKIGRGDFVCVLQNSASLSFF